MSPEAEDQKLADFQPKNILVPVDFSPLTLKALACARALVERFGGVVHLVHIAEPLPIIAGIDAVAVPINEAAQLDELERVLAEHAKELPRGSVGRTIVRQGWAAAGIVGVAKELQADLIVIPTHGYSGIKRVVFGSVAEGVVWRAPCAVFVLRAGETDTDDTSKVAEKPFTLALKTILVPVDFSASSRKALACAIAFARRFQAKLICLHILEVPPSMEPDLKFTDLDILRKGLFAATEDTLKAFLKEANSQIPRENVLIMGSASREIIRIGEELKADLIAMGPHGKAVPGRFLLGSTAERVLRHAHCHVLVVRARE